MRLRLATTTALTGSSFYVICLFYALFDIHCDATELRNLVDAEIVSFDVSVNFFERVLTIRRKALKSGTPWLNSAKGRPRP